MTFKKQYILNRQMYAIYFIQYCLQKNLNIDLETSFNILDNYFQVTLIHNKVGQLIHII